MISIDDESLHSRTKNTKKDKNTKKLLKHQKKLLTILRRTSLASKKANDE